MALDVITCASWRPDPLTSVDAVLTRGTIKRKSAIAYCTGTSRVYLYEIGAGNSPISVNIPGAAYAITSLSWSNDGTKLLLQGNESLSLLNVDHMLSE